MNTLVILIHVLVSIFLVAAVLLQFGKGASMGSSFGAGSSQTMFGSSGPTTLLGKVTMACAAIFMVTSLYLSYVATSPSSSSIMTDVKTIEKPVEEAPAPLKQGTPEETPGTTAK